MLPLEADRPSKGKWEVNVGDSWRVYGVSERGHHHEKGLEDIPQIRGYGCGVCGMTFGLEIYATIGEFYTRHYSVCGIPKYGDNNWEW